MREVREQTQRVQIQISAVLDLLLHPPTPTDGSLLLLEEDINLGDGRSLVLGSSPPESGCEGGQGAAAVGR